eukprot:CAMPEP_0170486234 /NCGR_PEP_ID=MMETSP0208-20121228/5296_1 /TAXON_ID=197538 /ORGANISM="Strombidium inclinatum, Strain S3" /LENGTH=65 /DNA_ID=CAMNT_0010760105 /DNA_START=161 /DNA_END=358 /DNA_ORIENTATION=-
MVRLDGADVHVGVEQLLLQVVVLSLGLLDDLLVLLHDGPLVVDHVFEHNFLLLEAQRLRLQLFLE